MPNKPIQPTSDQQPYAYHYSCEDGILVTITIGLRSICKRILVISKDCLFLAHFHLQYNHPFIIAYLINLWINQSKYKKNIRTSSLRSKAGSNSSNPSSSRILVLIKTAFPWFKYRMHINTTIIAITTAREITAILSYNRLTISASAILTRSPVRCNLWGKSTARIIQLINLSPRRWLRAWGIRSRSMRILGPSMRRLRIWARSIIDPIYRKSFRRAWGSRRR